MEPAAREMRDAVLKEKIMEVWSEGARYQNVAAEHCLQAVLEVQKGSPPAEAAMSAWVHSHNHDRPHQALGMATPEPA